MQRHEPAADAAEPGIRPEERPLSVSRLLAACAAATAVSTPPFPDAENGPAGDARDARDGPGDPGTATARQAA